MLKPIDIQNKDFEKKLKGYDCDEVDEFLDLVLKDYDMLCRENKYLKEKNADLKESVDRYRLMEVTIKQTVEVAQKNADEIVAAAKLEAKNITKKAEQDAKKAASAIDEEHLRKHHELLGLKSQVETYRQRMKTLSETILKMMDEN